MNPSIPSTLQRVWLFSLAFFSASLIAPLASAQIAIQTSSAPTNAYLSGLNTGGAVSADGSTFVYSGSTLTSNFIWNTSTGATAVRLDPSSSQEFITGLSSDGSTVVGFARTGPGGPPAERLWTPYIWSNGTATALATPSALNVINSTYAISADGSQVSLRFENQYYLWTSGGGLGSPVTEKIQTFSSDGSTYVTNTTYHHNSASTALPSVSSLTPENGHNWNSLELRALTANGQVAVGSVINDVSTYTDPDFRSQAVRWTEAGGYQLLGYLPGFRESDALNISDDGSIITGMYGPPVDDIESYTMYPFIWDLTTGMRPLGDALAAAGLDVTGWEFQSGAIAADGTTIVGTGLLNGASTLFRVTGYTPVSAVPEPSTDAELAGLAVFGLVFWRRRNARRND
ncbi:MAG: PEP-CTERM sorting domain-containing protein [Opitutaceae bacterium]|nr:PEP-CTERM sorting domain-containing protein [Opitutaceae bacterium]